MTRNTNTEIPPEERPEVDKGRKPYYEGKSYEDLDHREFLHGGDGGGSYQAMMRRQPYLYSKQAQLQHSQFKRTYAGDEFIEMEGFADLTQLDLLEFVPWQVTFDFEIPPGEVDFEGERPGSGSCMVACDLYLSDFNWNDDCTELEVYFKGSFALDTGETLENVPIAPTTIHRGTGKNVYVFQSNHAFIRREEADSFGGELFGQKLVFYNIPAGKDIFAIFYQDIQARCPGAGISRCMVQQTFVADCCTIEWDYDNSDHTVARNGTADVFVIGGEDTYSWTLTQPNGSGFSLGSATTTVPQNTVDADATACGSCHITVTSCGDSTEGTLRCPDDGAWVFIEQATAPGEVPWPFTPTYDYCAGPGTHTEYGFYGSYRILETVTFGNSSASPSCADGRCIGGLTPLQADFQLNFGFYPGGVGCCQYPLFSTCSRMTLRRKHEWQC